MLIRNMRANLTIIRFQKLKWIMRMIEYMLNLININAYLVWIKHQAKKNFDHKNRRVFIQKLIAKLLRNSNIIHQAFTNITSIYCSWNECAINNHAKSRKRQTLVSISINISRRQDRRTFDYCMTCKKSLCVKQECFNSYHESIEMQYKCSDQ